MGKGEAAWEDVEWRAIEELKPHPANPRLHDELATKAVADSIARFGWTNPIVINAAGQILSGHSRHKAARKLGQDAVPTITVDLTPEQEIAYMIADNKTASLSSWQMQQLRELGQALAEQGIDLRQAGLRTGEVDVLIGQEATEAAGMYEQERQAAEADGATAHRVDKDKHWFYVEWPAARAEEFRQVVKALRERGGLKGANEIDPDIFERLVKEAGPA